MQVLLGGRREWRCRNTDHNVRSSGSIRRREQVAGAKVGASSASISRRVHSDYKRRAVDAIFESQLLARPRSILDLSIPKYFSVVGPPCKTIDLKRKNGRRSHESLGDGRSASMWLHSLKLSL
jgi:hypothetical protein